jgi:hypothetical protein
MSDENYLTCSREYQNQRDELSSLKVYKRIKIYNHGILRKLEIERNYY